MKRNFCYLIFICLIMSCVSNDSGKGKMSEVESLSIATINQQLYLDNQFKGTETLKLDEHDPLNTIGIVKAFCYKYLARVGENGGNATPRFYLAIYKYENAGNVASALDYYMEVANNSNGFWRYNDFLMPVGDKILLLHGDCSIPAEKWEKLKETITGTLEEIPKSINCNCGKNCLYMAIARKLRGQNLD